MRSTARSGDAKLDEASGLAGIDAPSFERLGRPRRQTMVPAALFLLLAFLIYWIVNKPSIADFMIAAEGEMKKVSWSSRQT